MKLGHPLPTRAVDLGLLLARVLLGVVLIAHGWQKFDTYTLDRIPIEQPSQAWRSTPSMTARFL